MLMITREPRRPSLIAIALLLGAGLAVPALVLGADTSTQPEQRPAEALYQQYCVACHSGGVPRAPHMVVFQMMGPEAILKSMQDGVMQAQAAPLTEAERRRLAEYLGGASLDSASRQPIVHCQGKATAPAPGTSDWGFDLENTRFIPANAAALKPGDVSKLRLKWAFAYPNATRARSQPTIVGRRVYMGSQDGTVYALELDSGCAHWTFKADAEVRSAITIAPAATPSGSTRLTAYFGDFDGGVYAVDAASGKLLWKSSLADHPDVTITGSPKLYGNRLYVPMSSSEWATAADPAYACCTFRGGIAAFDTNDGHMVWKSFSIPEKPKALDQVNSQGAKRWGPAGAPIWSTLTIDEKRRLIYAGTGESYTSPAQPTSDSIIAFDLETGAIKWHYQATEGDAWNMSCFIGGGENCPQENGPDFDFGAPPILLKADGGKDIILAGQKSGFVYALDPERQGALIWKRKTGLGGFAGGVHWGMAAHGDTVYVPNADTNFINKWKGERKPGLYALKARSGEVIWFTPAPDACPDADKPACDPGLSAAVTAIPGVVFAGAFDGHLRAYDSGNGSILWDFNTAREFKTLSGETARGGSIESDGPVISDGYVLLNSGYLFGSRMGGNVLLAFTVDGK